MNSRILTCVYCGQEYPQNTPAFGNKVLTDHIKVCEKHPMREAEKKIKILRQALVDIVGSDDVEELNDMKSLLDDFKYVDNNAKISLIGINVLLSIRG